MLAVAVLASFVAFLDGSVVNLALPAISRDLGGGLTLAQWVVDGYLLTLGALILVAGALSDKLGQLLVLRIGLIVFAVASLACAAAPTGWVLVAARCVQGIGAAFLVPSSLAMVNVRFNGARQAAAIGTWTAWTGTAFVVGPPLGGALVDALDWRWVFGINVVPLAATLYLLTRLTPGDFDERRDDPIDAVGAVLGALGLAATVFGLIEQGRLGVTHPAVAGPLAVGVVCLVAFAWWERRVPSASPMPLVPPTLFAQRNFTVGNIVTVFFYAAVSLGTLLLALFLQEAKGLPATTAGLVTLPVPLLSFLLARRFGALAGRHGPRLFMAIGPVVAGVGFVLMGVGSGTDVVRGILPGVVVFGMGLAIAVSPLTAAVLAAVEPSQSGVGSAVNNAVSRVAGLVAVALIGMIVGGRVDEHGFERGAFATAALFVTAGVCAAVGISNAGYDATRVSPDVAARCRDRASPPPALLSGQE